MAINPHARQPQAETPTSGELRVIHARNSRRASSRIPQAPSPIAESFALQIRADQLPRPMREYRFHPTRRWRLDFAWPDMRLAVEIDGEVHRIKDRFHADLEKHAALVLADWTLLRVGSREVRSGRGLEWLKAILWERVPLGLEKRYPGRDSPEPPRSEPISRAGAFRQVDRAPVDNPVNYASSAIVTGPKRAIALMCNDISTESDLT